MAKKPSTATPMDQLPTSGHAGLGGGGEYFGGGGGGSWGLGSAIAVTPAKAQAVTMATSAKLNVRVIPAVFLFMCIPSCFCGISSGSESLPPGIARKKFGLRKVEKQIRRRNRGLRGCPRMPGGSWLPNRGAICASLFSLLHPALGAGFPIRTVCGRRRILRGVGGGLP